MSKKVFYLVLLALVLALSAGVLFPIQVFAQGPNPGKNPDQTQGGPAQGGLLNRLRNARPVVGQVVALSEQSITIRTLKGEERTVQVSDRTRFTDVERAELSLDDVQKDGWVAVVLDRQRQKPGRGFWGLLRSNQRQEPAARAVVILPEGFDPETWSGVRGEVVQVQANSFTLEDRQGQQTNVKVTAETRFMGDVQNLAMLKTGMGAVAAVEEQADGSLVATMVKAGEMKQRNLGEITAVNAAGQQFTLKTLAGETLTIYVTADTQFRGAQSLADLKVGMKVLVVSQDEGGKLTAHTILANPRQQR